MGSKRYHNKEWLQEKYHDEGLTGYEIAELCDVTPTTISSWMDKHGIETRGQSDAQRPDGKHTDRKWLAEQYHGEGRSLSDMGEECDVTAATVMKWMDKHNIPRRDAGDHKRTAPASYTNLERGYVRLSSKTGGKNSYVLAHQLVAIADGADPHKVFSDGEYQCHHINGVKWDNRPENIEVLTMNEHDKLHAAERERASTGEFL